MEHDVVLNETKGSLLKKNLLFVLIPLVVIVSALFIFGRGIINHIQLNRTYKNMENTKSNYVDDLSIEYQKSNQTVKVKYDLEDDLFEMSLGSKTVIIDTNQMMSYNPQTTEISDMNSTMVSFYLDSLFDIEMYIKGLKENKNIEFIEKKRIDDQVVKVYKVTIERDNLIEIISHQDQLILYGIVDMNESKYPDFVKGFGTELSYLITIDQNNYITNIEVDITKQINNGFIAIGRNRLPGSMVITHNLSDFGKVDLTIPSSTN